MYLEKFNNRNVNDSNKNKSEKDFDSSMYLYKILHFAKHIETGEILVIYQALYVENEIYTRPIEIAYSEVNKEKYTNVK